MWKWSQIADLMGPNACPIGYDPQVAVDSFERVERLLGRAGLDRRFAGGRGSSRVVSVVHFGVELAAIEPAAPAALVARLVANDSSARSEVAALHLLRGTDPVTTAEHEPPVPVGHGTRLADWLVSRDAIEVYVEVATPDMSEAGKAAVGLAERIAGLAKGLGPFNCEVFLRREPTQEEVAIIRDVVTEACGQRDWGRQDIEGLALITISRAEGLPVSVTVEDHAGEVKRPRVGVVKFEIEKGQAAGCVIVRMPFDDKRAEEFLRKKARQLPKSAAGLVMIDASNVSGSADSWRAVFETRFNSGFHKRVSGVCSFNKMTCRSPLIVQTEVSLIQNPQAIHALPTWVVDRLSGFRPVGNWRQPSKS